MILNATEEVIRRFGPDKANITDVAKSLKVSHAAIYRYYNGKTALLNAVTERWLTHLHAPSNDTLKEVLNLVNYSKALLKLNIAVPLMSQKCLQII
ncbi:TetR/AcrR family transcriptional regulator [Clostridium chromiireducens]